MLEESFLKPLIVNTNRILIITIFSPDRTARPSISILCGNWKNKVARKGCLRHPCYWGHRDKNGRGVRNIGDRYHKLQCRHVARVHGAIRPGILRKIRYPSNRLKFEAPRRWVEAHRRKLFRSREQPSGRRSTWWWKVDDDQEMEVDGSFHLVSPSSGVRSFRTSKFNDADGDGATLRPDVSF